jgi:hypothetical protein
MQYRYAFPLARILFRAFRRSRVDQIAVRYVRAESLVRSSASSPPGSPVVRGRMSRRGSRFTPDCRERQEGGDQVTGLPPSASSHRVAAGEQVRRRTKPNILDEPPARRTTDDLI